MPTLPSHHGWAFTDGVKSRMLETFSPEEIREKAAPRLRDPDVAAWANLVHVVEGARADEHNALLPPDAFHLPVGRPVTHKIYRDAAHPFRLVLPFATVRADGEPASV
ncbi:hypothetical protein OIE75_02065 [Streptomyces sp. NBC_01723]|uniref:hypothetical protein n=1 Tax=Streptomyces sp. NBC_01723 TaxID=2975921 RepID=UPI002E3555C5|nr:hypothetical protein [Streptomyces sp. NBC_01723]